MPLDIFPLKFFLVKEKIKEGRKGGGRKGRKGEGKRKKVSQISSSNKREKNHLARKYGIMGHIGVNRLMGLSGRIFPHNLYSILFLAQAT